MAAAALQTEPPKAVVAALEAQLHVAKLEAQLAAAKKALVPEQPPQNTSMIDDDESCCVCCMSCPRAVRNQPCGHAICCELCTIRAVQAGGLKCGVCRGAVL